MPVAAAASIGELSMVRGCAIGARGVVLKDAVVAHLSACIRAVMQGQYWLDGRPVQNLVQLLRDLRKKVVIGFVGGSDLDKIKWQLEVDGLDGTHNLLKFIIWFHP